MIKQDTNIRNPTGEPAAICQQRASNAKRFKNELTFMQKTFTPIIEAVKYANAWTGPYGCVLS